MRVGDVVAVLYRGCVVASVWLVLCLLIVVDCLMFMFGVACLCFCLLLCV